MKREIEVWVNKSAFIEKDSLPVISFYPRAHYQDRATLIIDEPEKKVELTESEFDNIIEDMGINESLVWSRAIRELRQKLFRGDV